MLENPPTFSIQQKIKAWLVHTFTASGAVLGLFALWAVHEGNFTTAFWLMGGSIFVDAIDGFLARRTQAKIVVPQIDGALLDNIVDYFTYVILPAFLLLAADMLPAGWAFFATGTILLASAYQFTQSEAKTDDHFFKGFPCYWNITVFYLFFWQFNPWTNLVIILLLCVMVFIPIKYAYPSRLEYLTPSKSLRIAMFVATVIWGIATAGMLLAYPNDAPIFVVLSFSYCILYFTVSLYRTLNPVDPSLFKQDG